MGTFIVWGFAILIAFIILELAFKALGAGMRDFAVITREIMEFLGVRPEMALTRRERIGMVLMALLITAGVASVTVLLLHWIFT